MILYTSIVRLSDGTPLSVATEDLADNNVALAKKTVKSLVPKLIQLPKRVCLQEDHYTIHCVHTTVVGFIAVCSPTFSHLLANSLLDEYVKEFTMLYNSSVVAAVRRPYAFTEFDNFMQKLSHKYGSPQFVASRINLPELRAELGMNPPVTLSIQDIAPPSPPIRSSQSPPYTSVSIGNGSLPNGYASNDLASVGVSMQLLPLSLGARCIILIATCFSALDAYRGLSSLSQSSLEEYDGPSPLFGFGFMLECSILATQVQMLRKYQRFRKLWSLVSVLLLSILSLLLLTQVRDTWLSLVYILISAALAYLTLNRNFRKLNKFNV